MGTLDKLQSKGLFQNLEIHKPPKNHKVVMHNRHKWARTLNGKTQMKITAEGELLRLCPLCEDFHKDGECESQ
jgi:hypothetical protein